MNQKGLLLIFSYFGKYNNFSFLFLQFRKLNSFFLEITLVLFPLSTNPNAVFLQPLTSNSLQSSLNRSPPPSGLLAGKRADSVLSVSRNCFARRFSMALSKSKESRGALIVLEGLDRCGKTSQSSRLVSSLDGLGYTVELWRFPDRNTGVGKMISSYLSNETQLDDRTIHLLFSANRWEKRSLMESKLKSGTTLIVDRYSYSGVAFSSAKGLDAEWCKAPEKGLLAPDLVLYLDIQPEKAAERGGYGGERYEQLEFQKKVAQQYQTMRDPSWKIIDANLSMEDIEKQLTALVLDSVELCHNGRTLSQLWPC